LCLITLKVYHALKKPEKLLGGESMSLSSKEKIMPLAMVTLCVVIGVMSLLLVVYYANAINNQNQSRSDIASLQTQNSDLQNQITTKNSQISSLNTQLNTLSTDKQNLQGQVNQLSETVDSLASQLAQLEATMGRSVGGAPQRAI
jgi:septal ring factor EnvC (AmiA/AmiB activator)